MSLVSHLKKKSLIAIAATLLSSFAFAFASYDTSQKIAGDAMAALQSGQFEQSVELYDNALAEDKISDVVKGQVLSAKANALLELGWASRQEKLHQ